MLETHRSSHPDSANLSVVENIEGNKKPEVFFTLTRMSVIGSDINQLRHLINLNSSQTERHFPTYFNMLIGQINHEEMPMVADEHISAFSLYIVKELKKFINYLNDIHPSNFPASLKKEDVIRKLTDSYYILLARMADVVQNANTKSELMTIGMSDESIRNPKSSLGFFYGYTIFMKGQPEHYSHYEELILLVQPFLNSYRHNFLSRRQ